ncbi:hypothetical protein ACMFMG_010050, partial [Clarireedia jacksonii]
ADITKHRARRMSPISRWHSSSCRAPDIRLNSNHLPACVQCGSLFNPYNIESLCDLPQRAPQNMPASPRQEMSLSWPSWVCYLPESTSSYIRLKEVHREQLRAITADHDNQATSQLYLHNYEPLASADEIRILELSKGNPKDPLHGTLTKYRLNDFSHYEALSYTWENYDSTEALDNTPGGDVIYLGQFWDAFIVTRNCYKALRRLRYTDRTRLLWVDSICIDQNNHVERNQQVGLMNQIYKTALSVVVYLGNEDTDSPIALQVLKSPVRLRNLDAIELRALKALFKRPYFSRLWIVQEVALAKSLYFYCGTSETFIPLLLPDTLKALLDLEETVPAWIKYSYLWRKDEDNDLYSLLQDTISCHCSDPRDKVFGLLSLITIDRKERIWNHKLKRYDIRKPSYSLEPNYSLKPNYSLSVEEVYTGIAALLIKYEGLLSVLELTTRTPLSSSLPSWVPNWAACSLNSPRLVPASFLRPLSHDDFWDEDNLDKDGLNEHDLDKIFNMPIYNPSGHVHREYFKSFQVSVTGALKLEGILLSAHASSFERVKRDILMLRNYDRTLSIALYYTNTGYSDPNNARIARAREDIEARKSRRTKTARKGIGYDSDDSDDSDGFNFRCHNFIPNHICVLIPAPKYSLALILNPIDGKEEFTLLGVKNIGALITARRFVPLPALLCLLPISEKEREFARDGVISRPNEFPLLRDLDFIWKTSGNNPEVYWDQELVKVLESLISINFLDFHEKEQRLWATWGEFERECISMFRDPAKLEFFADYIHSLEGLTSLTSFQEDHGIPSVDEIGFRFANFLSLFILDPSKAYTTARDITLKYDNSKDSIGKNDDPKHTLTRLREWQICTFDLLDHMHYTSYHIMPFIDKLPGYDLQQIAESIWGYYNSIAGVLSEHSNWYGWRTWCMTKEIAYKYLEGEDLRGGSPNRLYWDWDHMKTTMDERARIWSQLIEFRRRLIEELGNCDFDLLAHKLGTRRLMKEVGYDLDNKAVCNRSVTIR